MFGLFSRARENLERENFASHMVGVSIFTANLVLADIAKDCPEFSTMFESDFDEWTRIWSTIFTLSLFTSMRQKLSPQDHEKLFIAFCKASEKAPRLGSIGNEYRNDLFRYVRRHDRPLKESLGAWVIEKSARRLDYTGKGEPLYSLLGQSILIRLEPYLSVVTSSSGVSGQDE